ncbi:hypothetical protein, partial [Falsigemmobacter intermedius]|uniref:hypothetical protein n=1 Tax=Falsigemmobacter intermedius TaxID=1553448 RepID=UPI0035F0AA4F
TAVWVPDAAHEAMRDLVRARATAIRVAGKARRIPAVRAVCPGFANRLKALPYVIFYTFSPDRDFHR